MLNSINRKPEQVSGVETAHEEASLHERFLSALPPPGCRRLPLPSEVVMRQRECVGVIYLGRCHTTAFLSERALQNETWHGDVYGERRLELVLAELQPLQASQGRESTRGSGPLHPRCAIRMHVLC